MDGYHYCHIPGIKGSEKRAIVPLLESLDSSKFIESEPPNGTILV